MAANKSTLPRPAPVRAPRAPRAETTPPSDLPMVLPPPPRTARPKRPTAKHSPPPMAEQGGITSAVGARRREAARIVVVTGGAALFLLVVNRSSGGLLLLDALDWGAYALPPLLVAAVLDLLRRATGGRPFLRFEEINGMLALFAAVLIAVGAQGHGGPFGNALANQLAIYFGALGIPLACTFLGALGLVLALHLTSAQLWRGLRVASAGGVRGVHLAAGGVAAGRRLARDLSRRRVHPMGEDQLPDDPSMILEAEVVSVSTVAAAPAAPPEPEAPLSGTKGKRTKAAEPVPSTPDLAAVDPLDEPLEIEEETTWLQPSMDLLDPVPVELNATPIDNTARMRLIEDTLAAFNVRAKVVAAQTGPTVTRFDVQPERGVRVARVTALQNDLALSLAARTIRILAPVPGQSVIGVEIPNAKTSLVTLREALESDPCMKMKSPLKIALGKDVSGESVMADLAKMPHLLIAGSTGSGKSVCLNSLISCLLFHNSPERLRLLMVDPKMVELAQFNGVPHLLAPVITDTSKVTAALKWAIKEMHRRYKLFAARGARNLARYNELQYDPAKRLPFIVIIIDELADLMMVSPEDVEDGICRLAQLARATGMHLVLATQRPSVDVITGLIKANFPARIAFAVSSSVDSRTILDQVGAEKLLGRGDMLYQPADEGKPIRVQGAYLSDKEIEILVEFWKNNTARPMERISDAELDAPAKEEESEGDDKLMNEAVKVLHEYKRASVSLLQRRLSIGYTRAARLLDTLEERGIVGPSEDGRSRVVLESADDGSTATVVDDDPDLGDSDDSDDKAPPL